MLGIATLLLLIPIGKVLDSRTSYEPDFIDQQVIDNRAQAVLMLHAEHDHFLCETEECWELADRVPKLLNQKWDSAVAAEILDVWKPQIHLVDELLTHPVNEFKASHFNPNLSFAPGVDLLLLQSRFYAEQGDIPTAVTSITKSLEFSNKLIVNGDPLLVALGRSFRERSFDWMHRLMSIYEVPSEAIRILLKRMVSDSDLLKRKRSESHAHNYLVIAEYAHELAPKGFSERANHFKNSAVRYSEFLFEPNTPDFGPKEFGFTSAANSELSPAAPWWDSSVFKTELVRILEGVAPDFFRPPNAWISLELGLIKENQVASQQSCNKVNLPLHTRLADQYENSVFSFLRFNGSVLRDHSLRGAESNLRDFIQNCMHDFYAESIKTVLAIKLFQAETQSLPSSLQQLVPGYLNQEPNDPLTGELLGYDPQRQLLYSKGANFSDDGGSLESVFNNVCYAQTECRNNPTVPITHLPQSRGQSHSYYAMVR